MRAIDEMASHMPAAFAAAPRGSGKKMSSRLLYGLNHARLWRRSVLLWDCRVRAASLDRLLFLALHRAGWMGAEEVAVLRRLVRPGMQVVDVGANVGLYSLLLGRLVGERGCVYSFEPEPHLCATLRENCGSNGITNVVPFEYAAGPSNARQRFQRATFNSGTTVSAAAHPMRERSRFWSPELTIFCRWEKSISSRSMCRGMSWERSPVWSACLPQIQTFGSSSNSGLLAYNGREILRNRCSIFFANATFCFTKRPAKFCDGRVILPDCLPPCRAAVTPTCLHREVPSMFRNLQSRVTAPRIARILAVIGTVVAIYLHILFAMNAGALWRDEVTASKSPRCATSPRCGLISHSILSRPCSLLFSASSRAFPLP